VKAQSNTDLPFEAQNNNGLPIVGQPFEEQNNDNLSIFVEPNEVENENQVWFIKYRKELQGLVITDREIDSHYYDIHTALLNTFLKNSCAILILECYVMALIKQMNIFFLFDSHARDSNGMPDPNGTAVVMKFNDILDLEQHFYFLSMELHTNLFEIVPVQLITSETNSERKARLSKAKQSKKQKHSEENDNNRQIRLQRGSESKKRKQSEETNSDRQIRLQKANKFKKRKQSEETDSDRQIRLQKVKESKKRKQSEETDSERQLRLEKDRLYQKQKHGQRVSQPQCETSQQDYLNMFDSTQNGGIEKQCWAKANINKFHKSVQYNISQFTVFKEAWPLKSKPRSPYVCSRCCRDKKSPQKFSSENSMIPSPVPN
jgi:hypothetical protein